VGGVKAIYSTAAAVKKVASAKRVNKCWRLLLFTVLLSYMIPKHGY